MKRIETRTLSLLFGRRSTLDEAGIGRHRIHSAAGGSIMRACLQRRAIVSNALAVLAVTFGAASAHAAIIHHLS